MFNSNIKDVEELFIKQQKEIITYYSRISDSVLNKYQMLTKHIYSHYNNLFDIVETYDNVKKVFNS